MTISLACVRNTNNTTELVFSSDSRLRSRGAIDECQKLFPLSRGDCCLGFCGDTQIAYPLFMQVSSTLDNYFGTSSRATDVTDLVGLISSILKQLISSWDFPRREKLEELEDAKILFGGWSWKYHRFDLGAFELSQNCEFVFHHRKFRIGHPWYERSRSLIFLGNYEKEYRDALVTVLEKRYARNKLKNDNPHFNFDYEPIEALQKNRRAHRPGKIPQSLD